MWYAGAWLFLSELKLKLKLASRVETGRYSNVVAGMSPEWSFSGRREHAELE